MGCTTKDKKASAHKKAQSAKPNNTNDVDHHQKSKPNDKASNLAKSGQKPWTCKMGCCDKNQHPKSNRPQNNPSLDDCCSWGYCTEDQLEEILLKNLEFLYSEAVSKLVALGYDEEVALKAVMREGYWYEEGSMDVLSNILENSLSYLNGGAYGSEGDSEESEFDFANLRQLEEESLADMVRLLQQYRPQLSRGDALWCLLMSNLDVGRARTLEIPRLPCCNVDGSGGTKCGGGGDACVGSNDGNNPKVRVPPGLCKFHGSWDLQNGPNSKVSFNGFGEFLAFSEAALAHGDIGGHGKKLNLSPSMKSMLKRNFAALAAGFLSKQQLQMMQSHSCHGCADSSEGAPMAAPADSSPVDLGEESCDSDTNQDVVNSILKKFQDMGLDEKLTRFAEDQKDELILSLSDQVKDLEKQVKERKEWAHQKALQAAKKLSSDLTELKILRMEREETHRLKKGKQTLEDKTMKRLSEMETALRKASSQVDRANAAVRHLEIENAEIRAEMEASKLSASESMKACLEVAKREKKCLKRLLAWEKQKTKLQEEVAAEKRKISGLQRQLVQINAAQKDTEAKWRQEVTEKELAMARVEEERRSKETSEGNSKRNLETLRLRIDIDFQRHKDDLQRLEQELSRLKSTTTTTTPPHARTPETARHHHHYHHQGDPFLYQPDEPETEAGSDRQCLICKKEEVSVVFLPCAHQVMCVNCGESYGKKAKKATCPCCRVPIEQRIRVFGVSS